MNEQSIFIESLEIESDGARRDFLRESCPDTAMRSRIERLLLVQQKVGGFMEEPAASDAAADVFGSDLPFEEVGASIGPYKLLEQIGEGGMGVVYMAAQQTPVKRKVAIKVIKPGMDTKQVIARFEAERPALALMDHPNIARVVDAGATESGRPYFVMELVRGIPLTDYCQREALGLEQRLALFVDVCHAVQHAHLRGIIHRDIKPSNVMVTLHDGISVVKMIDFCVAKAMNQQLTEKTLFTNYSQMIGTPLYMSPEQAEMSGLDVDTRSDIYSLGVLLYEILTETTPFEQQRLKEAGYDEMRRIIREEEPPRASTRVSTLQNQSQTLSDQRRTNLAQLGRALRSELDWTGSSSRRWRRIVIVGIKVLASLRMMSEK
jgi:serine/threonine protein kinase